MAVEPNKRYPIGIVIVENPVQELKTPSPTFNNKKNYSFVWVALMCRLFSSSSSATELFKGSFKR